WLFYESAKSRDTNPRSCRIQQSNTFSQLFRYCIQIITSNYKMNHGFKNQFKMSHVSVTRKFKIQRKWTSEEVKQVLEKLKATIRMGQMMEVAYSKSSIWDKGPTEHLRTFMKPTAEVYYNKMLSELQFICCNVSQIKNKVRNLRKCYIETTQWRDSAGQGILEKSGAESLRAIILSKCPDFDDLDEIFGNTIHVSPLCVISSVASFSPSEANEQSEKKNFIFGKDELVSDGEDETSHLSDPQFESTTLRGNETENRMKSFPVNGDSVARNECRIVKDPKWEMEMAKFNFEKEKWRNELELRRRQLDLDEKKLEFEMANAKYEIEMKYSTQLQIAKLNC
uniref:Myb/SANT-like DNA-binding domain-containing protein n=1 Tax=Strigamia maritima TaxID=126957 RepID=T1JGI1_STRMM